VAAVGQNVRVTTDARPLTLRQLSGLPDTLPDLADSIVIVIDAQREYLDGALPLDGISASLANIDLLLRHTRDRGGHVVHVVHQGRPGGAFDPERGGRIIDQIEVAPGEAVVSKTLPNSFAGTELRELIAEQGDPPIVLCGFMTHMCVSASARAALDLGLSATVAGDACATRPLPSATTGDVLAAATIHEAALAELADRFAVVTSTAELVRAG
jgi:nicotinamidase-related amidase